MPFFELRAELWTLTEQELDKYVKDFVQEEMKKAIKAFLKATLARIPVRTGFLKGSFTLLREAFGLSATSDLSFRPKKGASEKKKKELEAQREVQAFLKGLRAHGGLFKQQELAYEASRERGKLHPKNPKDVLIERRKKLQEEAKASYLKRRKTLKTKVPFQEYYYFGKGQKILKTPKSGIPFNTKPEDVLKVEGLSISFQLDVRISYYRINDFFNRIPGSPWGSLDAGSAAMLNSLEHAANRFPDLERITGRFKIELRKQALTARPEPNTQRFRTFKIEPFN